jgi:hypothetical protein
VNGSLSGAATWSNKGMQLTRPVQIGASQLIPSVRRTRGTRPGL